MSFGNSIGAPGSSGQAELQHVQKKLHSLLQQLRWSYVALWTFNPQSRSLEWTAGHSREKSPVRREAEVWNDHLFNLLKSCMFTPGRGSVGTAYAEQRNIWMNGPSVHLSAGSEVQAKILKSSRIETAVYIPSAATVLELGTSEYVAEDIQLLSSVCVFMWEQILPVLGHAQALNQETESHEQTRSRASTLNIDMFLQHPDEGEIQGLTSGVPSEPVWISSPTLTTTSDLVQTPKSPFPPAATNQALMRFQTYRSLSGSSLSSLEDSSVKFSADSPEQSISLFASSSLRHNSQNYASSSARRATPSNSPELHPLRVDATAAVAEPRSEEHDIQQAIQQMLGAGLQQEPWPQVYADLSGLESGSLLDHAFDLWPHTQLLPRRERRARGRGILRRYVELLRLMPNPQQRNQTHLGITLENRPTSSSSPEDLPTEQDLQEQAGPSRGPGRAYRGGGRGGTPGSGQDEAAKYHMMSERRRRMKQKENFTALRKLVPIISKNDKASILGDAIIYLKDLQVQIQQLQADNADLQSRYEALTSSHQALQERNKLLEAMITQGGASVLPPQ